MKMLLKVVLPGVYAAALCCAQVASSSALPAKGASGTPPEAQAKPSPSPQSTPDQSEVKATAPQPVPAGKSDSTHKAYVIGPLDVLTIKVWNQPNLSGAVSV